MSTRRALTAAAISAAFLLTGCGSPLTDALQPSRPQQTISSETTTPAAESTSTAADAEDSFDDTCQALPKHLVEWLDANSWEYSKTHPSGDKGWMVSAGTGDQGREFWVAAVPVREGGYKTWAWAPTKDGQTVWSIMPTPRNWDGSSGAIKNRTGAQWPAEAQQAAVECLSR